MDTNLPFQIQKRSQLFIGAMRANHGANPKGGKKGRRMNDTQILVLIHTVAWPILIWALSKAWKATHDVSSEQLKSTMNRGL